MKLEADVSDIDTGEVPRDTRAGDMQDALRSLQDFDRLKGVIYEQQQWRANREGAHLLILDFEKAFIKRLESLGLPFFAHCVVRTKQQQKKEFDEGHSKNDGSKPFPHDGTAVDIIHSKYGWNLSKDQWKIIIHIGKEVAKVRGIDITNGADFKGLYDPAHWQLTEWRERQKELLR